MSGSIYPHPNRRCYMRLQYQIHSNNSNQMLDQDIPPLNPKARNKNHLFPLHIFHTTSHSFSLIGILQIEHALSTFCDKWKTTYPKVVKSLRENPYIFTFYSFPKPIWRSIYSTNLIESFNKQIKKYTNRKEQFPHEEAL